MKKVKAQIGDLFAVPRLDGKYVVGQILYEWLPKTVCVAIFDFVIDDFNCDTSAIINKPTLLALPSVAIHEINKGYWTKVGTSTLLADFKSADFYQFVDKNFIGAAWHSGEIVENFVNAYYGLSTWDPYPGRLGFLQSLLIKR
jgi:hypothetical protein